MLPDDAGIHRRVWRVATVVPRVFRLLWEVSPASFIANGVLMVIVALAPAGTIWCVKLAVDAVVEMASRGETSWGELIWPVAALLALWLLRAACQAIMEFVQRVLGQKVGYVAQRKVVEKAASLDAAFFESPKSYDWLHQASRQLDRIQYIAESSMTLVQSLIGLAAMIGLLAVLGPMAVVVLLATTLPRVGMEGAFAKRSFDLQIQYVRSYRMVEYLVRLLTTREPVKETRMFRLKDYLVAKLEDLCDRQLEGYKGMQLGFLKTQAGFDLLATAGLGAIWVYALYEAVLRRISIGDLTLVLQSAQQAQSLLTSVIGAASGVYRDALFATHFFTFLDMDPKSVEGALVDLRDDAAKDRGTPAQKMIAGIEVDNVSFKYPGTENFVLRDVSFEIPAGGKLALVGENGAGKTTLVKLLCRLYDPTEGAIRLDGRDLRSWTVDELRRHFAVVFQDYLRYDLSAADNIGVGFVEAIDERERVVAAADKGGARKTIDALPNGFDTMLGRTFEDGADLSGGEWQHVAISRAFMSDAEIMILDEPTSALDAFREQRLYDQLATLSTDKTTIFVSHRFSTVRMADLIVVIGDGGMVEKGTHEELLQLDGRYAAMFNAQAARYR